MTRARPVRPSASRANLQSDQPPVPGVRGPNDCPAPAVDERPVGCGLDSTPSPRQRHPSTTAYEKLSRHRARTSHPNPTGGPAPGPADARRCSRPARRSQDNPPRVHVVRPHFHSALPILLSPGDPQPAFNWCVDVHPIQEHRRRRMRPYIETTDASRRRKLGPVSGGAWSRVSAARIERTWRVSWTSGFIKFLQVPHLRKPRADSGGHLRPMPGDLSRRLRPICRPMQSVWMHEQAAGSTGRCVTHPNS